jgi:hypothetical protein
MRSAAAVNANQGMIIGAVLWPPDYVAYRAGIGT